MYALDDALICFPALKIHISRPVKLALGILGGYDIQPRGSIDIKVGGVSLRAATMTIA